MSVEVIETTEFFKNTQGFEINMLMAKITFRTEVVEDRNVTFNQIQGL